MQMSYLTLMIVADPDFSKVLVEVSRSVVRFLGDQNRVDQG